MKERGTFAVVREHADAVGARGKMLAIGPTPYETFDASLDYFGDGSVVFVPLFGHTPGSLGTFVNRNARERLFHVGDATNSTEAIERRVGKSFALAWTDGDLGSRTRCSAKLSQLHEQDPELKLLPAHDRRRVGGGVPRGPGNLRGSLRSGAGGLLSCTAATTKESLFRPGGPSLASW